jgi:hypothetical protein
MSGWLTGFSMKNQIEQLGISSSNDIDNLNDYTILAGTSIGTLNTHINTTDALIGVSIGNVYTRENYLQNQINNIVSLGISSGNVDLLFSVSIAVLDAKVGNQLGITNTDLNNSVIDLGVSVSSLGVSLTQASGTYSLIGVSGINNTTNLNSLGGNYWCVICGCIYQGEPIGCISWFPRTK